MKASISRIKCFKSCRRAYYLKYQEGLVPVQTAEPLETGKSYHEYIEGLYRGEAVDGTDKAAAMAKAYEKYIMPQIPSVTPEISFEATVGKHQLIGRIDGMTPDGWLVEHKTTSSDITEGGQYEYDLQWDEQLPAYFYAMGTRKAKYTVVKKPTIRLKKDETEEEFFERMVAWYDEDTESKIRVFEVSRTTEEIAEFAEEFEKICDEIENADYYYRNCGWCNVWGRRCEYSSICLN